MAKLRNSNIVKENTRSSFIKLKVVVGKLQKSLLNLHYKSPPSNLPEDVKEGHFAVIAVEDDEEKRFVVPLIYLTHPSFLKLLEGAAEEYGFAQEGALTIPCRPVELERMLVERERVLEMELNGIHVNPWWKAVKHID